MNANENSISLAGGESLNATLSDHGRSIIAFHPLQLKAHCLVFQRYYSKGRVLSHREVMYTMWSQNMALRVYVGKVYENEQKP